MSHLIEIRDMDKIYTMGSNEVRALDNLDLMIDEHEYVAIIGPSGSGKSTLMNMIGCLDVPTKGYYALDGKDVSKCGEDELSDVRNKKIGFIFQKFNLLPSITALENVAMPAMYYGLNEKQRNKKALEALGSVGLSERVDHKPTELSGGQQQRVAIARALVNDPAILLADEPTGNLDSKSGVEVLAILDNLYNNGATIILITHDNDVAQHAHRIVRLIDGRIEQDYITEKGKKLRGRK